MPPVNRLYSELKPKGLEVVLVDIRERRDLVARTARERGYVAPVLLDESGDVAGVKYGVWGTPTMYVIDRQGRLLARGIGRQDWASPTARKFVEDLLALR